MGRRAERWLDRRQLLQPINCNSTHCLYKTFAPCPTQDFLRLPHTTLDGSGWTTDAHDDRSYAETAQAKNSVDATDDREMRLCCPKGEVCEVIQELRFGVEDDMETNKCRTVACPGLLQVTFQKTNIFHLFGPRSDHSGPLEMFQPGRFACMRARGVMDLESV